MKYNINILAICLLLLHNHCSGQQTVGAVVSYQKVAGGIQGRTTRAQFDIRAYSNHTIRVRVTQHNQLQDFSYALANNQQPVYTDVTVTEKAGTIFIATHAIIAELSKAPYFTVCFKDSAGNIINEDSGGEGFGTSFNGNKLTVYKKLQEGERFVGLGEALGNLDKRGLGFTLSNTDNYKYGDPRIPMYISIPFFIGIHHKNVYGLFFNNSYRSQFNFGASNTRFSSMAFDGGDADYFLMYDENIAGILEQYTSLTGRINLPPLWSLGYHQSRCSYYPQSKVMTLANTFRDKKIPIDCIVLDADYLQEYEPFRTNLQRFPDMPGLAAKLRSMHIELTASVNPGIKLDSSYTVHRDGLAKDVFLKYTDGSLYEAPIDPSLDHFVDFTSVKGRQWWIENMKYYADNGIHGYWNDMNEPAVSGQYIPDNVVFDFDGHKSNSLEGRNVYGMQMARASFEAAQKNSANTRPFVLTRSAFAGVQRYAAVWSGDNQAKDEYLLNGFLLNTQMGLSGIPFVGPDLGGYIGDGNKDLYKRWVEAGVFSPFVRNHREAYAAASEPWSYGEEAEGISKTYIELRYRLLPYIYAKFYEAAQTGIPIARSLCMNFPFDKNVYDNLYQYQFLFGDALLLVPVTSQEKFKKYYLPAGNWYDAYSDSLYSGNREYSKEFPIFQQPLYIAASSIIPMQSVTQSTREKPSDTLYIHLYNGTKDNSFTYYEDDGETLDYTHGVYYRRNIVFSPGNKTLQLTAKEGSYTSQFTQVQLILHGFDTKTQVNINGIVFNTIRNHSRLLEPLDNLQDVYDKDYYKGLQDALPVPAVQTIRFAFSEASTVIHF